MDSAAGSRGDRWSDDEVLALAPDAASAVTARAIAVPSSWSSTGADGEAVWGRYDGGTGEAYQVVVATAPVAFGCSCPSRRRPCKHGLALLLLWARGDVPDGPRPGRVAEAVARLVASGPRVAARRAGPDEAGGPVAVPGTPVAVAPPPAPDPARERRAAEREQRVQAGLDDLDRWLADQVRAGLVADHVADRGAWQQVAARLVDAQAGSLANRVRRVAARVGSGAGWHEQVLAELGTLHALAVSGQRAGRLPPDLASSVRQAIGWTVAQAEVRAGVPVTDRWHVAARSITPEERIVVRRTWLWGQATRRWAVLYDFAVHEDGFDTGLAAGTGLTADAHPYPGALPLRVLLGHVHEAPAPDRQGPPAGTMAAALEAQGQALAAEPWLERWPACVAGRLGRDGRQWVLVDETGALALHGAGPSVPILAAVTAGGPVGVTGELSVDGFRPLAAHLDGRTVAL